MRFEIKNMICRHCIAALENMFRKLGYDINDVGLGFIDIKQNSIDEKQIKMIDDGLHELGFERIRSTNDKLVEIVKRVIYRHLNEDEPCPYNMSECIEQETGNEYKSVSKVFSAYEGRTIEKFYITLRIEKVKELISYGDKSLSEIAYQLGFSSVAHLSRQFKDVVGLTPTQYVKTNPVRVPINSF